jgi:hypothetical protein
VLIVQADSSEGTLPASWRLQWVADSSGIQFAALDSIAACQADTAKIAAIDQPASSADSAAHAITAHFCSAGASPAIIAYHLVDLVGGSRGKLKAVALDPADSTSVIESNEITFNGGTSDPYQPLVLRARSVHQSLRLEVTTIGSDLSGANSLSIVAPDGSWSLPLTITTRSETSLTGSASVAALLSACEASVGSTSGAASAAFLPADQQPDTVEAGGCSAQYFEELLLPPPGQHGYTIQPKDFAFIPGFVDPVNNQYGLHLFYIRHNYWYDQPSVQLDPNEKNFGHAWTSDFISWHGPTPQDKPDTLALSVRPGKFDELHVWAPTIVRPSGSPIFHMFYTGVRNESGRRHQRIGVATSTDLNTWTPSDAPVLTAPQIQWAKKNPSTDLGDPYSGAQQLRDPFVMEDPVHPGKWLMYFVAEDSIRAPKMAVGVATSPDLVTWTALNDPFSATERPTFKGATTIVESPHLWRRNGRWWMPYTVNLDQVFFETSASTDPADTVAASWSNPIWLRGVSEGRPAELQYWHATEHLGGGTYEYMAAFDDNATSIDIKGVFLTDSTAVDSFRLGCPLQPPTAGVGDETPRALRLIVSSVRWGTPEVGLRLELPSRMPVRLAVYDIAGRQRSIILNRELPSGSTNLKWDGGDASGGRVASGIYFIRLTSARGARVSKVVMLR